MKVSIEEHILSFFSFFGNVYKPKQFIISPNKGKLLIKKSSEPGNIYVLDILSNENIAINVDLSAIESFQKYCRISVGMIDRNNQMSQTKNYIGIKPSMQNTERNLTDNDKSGIGLDACSGATTKPSDFTLKTDLDSLIHNRQHLRTVISECLVKRFIISSIQENYKMSQNVQQYTDVEYLLKAVLPSNAYLYLYGSRIYGVANVNSDLNIFVDLGKKIVLYFMF